MTNRFFSGQTDYIEQLNALDGETADHIADTTGAHAATAISNTPAGNIAATTVQAAINELDGEKLSASAATLPSSFVNASLNSITPTGGTLSVTGSISATGGTMTDNLAFANGKGIDFSGTPGSGTSELLNDYEEGTWSPVLTPASGTITPNVTYTGGTYTKVGDLVTVNGCIYVTSVSSPTGALSITGLPFATKSGTQNYRAGSVAVTDMVATLNEPVQLSTPPGSSSLVLSKIVNGVGAAMAADVQALSDIRFSITYQI